MIEIQDWGLIDYKEGWRRQRELAEDIKAKRNRSVLILCEHPTVITIGRTGSETNVLSARSFLESRGVKIIHNDRGGDVTLHNPGQLVGYPIFNLSDYKEDLHWFLREIEGAIIDLLSLYGIESDRMKGLTGVWVGGERKICAMGLHCSKWVTSHGFALNAKNNIDEFDYITPCGIKDKEITSIEREIGAEIDFDRLKNECSEVFEKKFG